MKISTLTLNNFRGFPGPESQTFNLDAKNLLVYGENGSGKSSLFHALKTFFTLNNRNLIGETCNIFSKDVNNIKITDHWVEVNFDDGQPPVRWTGPRVAAAWTTDMRVAEAALRRGCLDYKALLDTNYRHLGGDINLFEVAVEHLLSDFKPSASPKTIGELWEEVEAARPVSNRTQHIRSAEQACTEFNTAFGSAVQELLPEINRLLPKLAADSVRLNQLVFASVSYDKVQKTYVGMSLIPRITFCSETVAHPHDFLNEARLSAIGLSIYLAGRILVPKDVSYAAPLQPPLKLLVLDDVLLGIDLSNRLPLLDLLREEFQEWQIVLLTFDRIWFDMVKTYTEQRKKWRYIEIFERICLERNIPVPIVRKLPGSGAKGCLEDAENFLDNNYLPAAANYARSAFELTLKMCCARFSIPVRYRIDSENNSGELLSAIEQWLVTEPNHSFLDASIERVKMFRKIVLNQGSHASPPNIARSEALGAIRAVHSLLKLTEPKSITNTNSLDKGAELANEATLEAWIASLGYLRGALAVRLRKFCKDNRIEIRYGDRSVETLWKTVYDDHIGLFTNTLTSVPGDIERERPWLIAPVTDTQLTTLTQADLQRLISILNLWR